MREFDRESRAATFLALDGDPAAEDLHELADDGQTESRAAGAARARSVGAIEAVEDVGEVRSGDAAAVVADGDSLTVRNDVDPSLGTDVRECVAHEIREDLLQPHAIDVDERVAFHLHVNAGIEPYETLQLFAEIDALDVQRELARLGEGEGLQVFDAPLQDQD